MNERGKKLEPKLGLDMPFAEALKRFIKTDPKEVEESIARAKKSDSSRKTRKGNPSGKG
jgi:hypothetical protein